MNQRKIVETTLAPPAIGPYSQAVIAQGFLYMSGQLGIDPATGAMVESGREEQFEQIFKNAGHILEAAGCGFKDVVKCTGFLTDMDDFPLFNKVYSRYFQLPYPHGRFLRYRPFPRKVPSQSWN